MKARLIFATLSIFFFSHSFSQESAAPKAVLTESDVDKFVETFVPMSKELNQLGDDYKYDENNPGQMWKANAEARSILNKYGWGETFELKFAAIIWAYSYTKIMVEIDNMPEEQKAQAQQMGAWIDLYTARVHTDDINLVKAKMNELDPVFEELEKD